MPEVEEVRSSRSGTDYKDVVVGVIVTKRRYIAHKKKEHWVRVYSGFAISLRIVNELQRKRVDDIQFNYRDEKGCTRYRISLEDFITYGTKVNFIHEEQIACGVDKMERLA